MTTTSQEHDPDIAGSIQIWRAKAAAGTITTAEVKAALAAMRVKRTEASATSSASKERKTTARKKKEPIDAAALLALFE